MIEVGLAEYLVSEKR